MAEKVENNKALANLQLKLLQIQQGVWNKKERVIIVFEGMDASGKGGAIRHLTEKLDPRGVRVHPIGPPTSEEQGIHWLYRFWARLPSPGTIAIYDRSWYGRVLVERVDGLTPKKDWQRAYGEILQFERMLTNDGIKLIKFFLQISKEEQLKRFKKRLNDPAKQWKITTADIDARKKWNEYELAINDMIQETSMEDVPWHVIDGNNKKNARRDVLKTVIERMDYCKDWLKEKTSAQNKMDIAEALKNIT
jgi:AMP-polyphosphate phosphotransferase